MLTRESVLERVRENQVKFLRMQLTDMFGALKNIAITTEDLERALAGQVLFDSSVVDGVVSKKEKDIVLLPDPSTFEVFPWRPREGAVARLICDATNPDGTPYMGCSRSVLKKVMDDATKIGYEFLVGAKIEFYLFLPDNKGNPTIETHDRAGFCDLTPLDLGENARRDMVLTMEEMGFNIGSSHHEVGPGQHQITLKLDNALDIADKLVTFKFIVRTIAQRHGLHASLMPKPLNDMPGSALHLQLFLHSLDNHLLEEAAEPLQINSVLGHFVAGILAHARANTAITNPIINSYKRLALCDPPTPVFVTWSEENRNSVIRFVPDRKLVEVRNPDSSCNPYLALAVILKAGIEGIQQKLPQPTPLIEDFQVNDPQILRASCLPANLEEALRELASDQLARSTLGEYIYYKFKKVKEEEWERFQAFVHPWELKEYLSTF